MYTSKALDTLTLILASQVRTDITSMARDKEKETGGNALRHYNVLNVKMSRKGDSAFPVKEGEKAPPNSYAIQLTITKSKVKDRYRGNKLMMYFYHGSFDHRFNVICIAKDLGIWDGKSLEYIVNGETKQFKSRGIKESVEKLPDEAVAYLEPLLMEAYTKQVMNYIPTDEEDLEEEDGAL
jgi:hypothetical protein